MHEVKPLQQWIRGVRLAVLVYFCNFEGIRQDIKEKEAEA